MATIGRLIRDERKQAGMTQEALAKVLRCSKSHLSLMESGQRNRRFPWRCRGCKRQFMVRIGRVFEESRGHAAHVP